MDTSGEHLFQQNKLLEEKFEYLAHVIESRIDKLFRSRSSHIEELQFDGSRKRTRSSHVNKRSSKDPFSSQTLLTFAYPYIKDFRNFSGPINEDLKQIQQLPTGMDDVDRLWKQKSWSKDLKHQLEEAVIENYAKNHLLKLVQQKNQLLKSQTTEREDVAQKVRLIDEQADQVRSRREPRIFVPEDRSDTQIDWCAISAKLTSYHHDSKDCRLMWTNQLHWAINNNDWTKDEDICLINAVTKHGKNDWDFIAHELNTGRVAWQCCARYQQNFSCVESSYHPESDETEKIIEVINLCKIGNFVPWNQVMYFIQFHSLHQVKHQWHRYLAQQEGTDIQLNNRVWSNEEDLLLLQAVARYGDKDWFRVADCVPGRTNKSCRERYIMRARFQKRAVGSWLAHEDSKLFSLVQQYGSNWSILAEHFPERNQHQIRNRHELLRSQNVLKRGRIKHRKLYRNLTLESVDYASGTKRAKPESEREVDRKLAEIFTSHQCLNKSLAPKKLLTCRSRQDEQIYQSLVETLCDMFLGHDKPEQSISSLDVIMSEAVKSCVSTHLKGEICSHDPPTFLLGPSNPTLQAYKVWELHQEHLRQITNRGDPDFNLSDIDSRITRIIVAIFFMPALLARIKVPRVDVSAHQVGSVIDKQSKNLYKIRSLQNNLLKR